MFSWQVIWICLHPLDQKQRIRHLMKLLEGAAALTIKEFVDVNLGGQSAVTGHSVPVVDVINQCIQHCESVIGSLLFHLSLQFILTVDPNWRSPVARLRTELLEFCS
jgi:hypothetical protein